VATSFLLAAAIFMVPAGRLADIHGRKRIFTIGVVIFSSGTAVAAAAPSGTTLIVARVIGGIGGAMVFGTGNAMLTSAYPAEERGRVLGINVATVYLGLSLGPSLGGFLTQAWGWRSVFWVGVPLGVLILILALGRLKGDWAEARGESFDLVGSVIYGLALLGLMLGLSELPAAAGVVMILAGVVGIVLFGIWESRTGSPVLDVRLFKGNRTFAWSGLAALINYSATFAVGFLLSLYLQYIKGMNPREAGLVLVAQPVMQALFSPFAGRLSDRIEPRVLASAGMGLTVVGLATLTGLSETSSVGGIVISLVILGVGFALFSSPNTNAIMSSVEQRYYGVASGVVGTMRLVGQMVSMGIVMLVFALLIGEAQITPDQYPRFLTSVRTDFLILSVLSVFGVAASLVRGRLRPDSDQNV
jgi:EmrB/QacA subfamily drug resistance transporter